MKGDEDAIYVKSFKDGDEKAFDYLYEKYQISIHAICYRYTRNEADARELTQDAQRTVNGAVDLVWWDVDESGRYGGQESLQFRSVFQGPQHRSLNSDITYYGDHVADLSSFRSRYFPGFREDLPAIDHVAFFGN